VFDKAMSTVEVMQFRNGLRDSGH